MTYGCPKVIEFDNIKSPGLTFLDFFEPSNVILSEVDVTSRPVVGISPIFTQLTPSSECVMNSIIGRGELPLYRLTTSQN